MEQALRVQATTHTHLATTRLQDRIMAQNSAARRSTVAAAADLASFVHHLVLQIADCHHLTSTALARRTAPHRHLATMADFQSHQIHLSQRYLAVRVPVGHYTRARARTLDLHPRHQLRRLLQMQRVRFQSQETLLQMGLVSTTVPCKAVLLLQQHHKGPVIVLGQALSRRQELTPTIPTNQHLVDQLT